MIPLLLPLLLASPDDLEARVGQAVAAWDRADSPGGAIAVVRGDEVVLTRTFGAASLDPALPITTSTPFYLASLAKPFTAACALRAEAEGLLDLDAPLPDAIEALGSAWAPATLRDCLAHRAGVPDVYELSVLADLGRAPVSNNAAAVELIARVGPSPAPGARFLYSNSGYVLLAEALGRAVERPLGAYARELLFEPLGMQEAWYEGQERRGAPAVSYEDGTPKEVTAGLTGPGGMYASLDDLIAFARALHAGRVTLPAGAAPRPRHPRVGAYLDGWMRQTIHGHAAVRHFGGAFGFGADLLHVPDLDLTVIVLANTEVVSPTDLAETVLSWCAPAGPAPAAPKGELAEGELGRLAGLWRTAAGDRILLLLPGRGGLRALTLGDIEVQLTPAGPQRLVGRDAQAPFALERKGDELLLDEDGTVATFVRATHSAPPSPQEVAGEYEAPALGARIRLVATQRGVRLEQTDPLITLPAFLPMADDLLVCDKGAFLLLERDEAGEVTGFLGSSNRAWGVRFERVR